MDVQRDAVHQLQLGMDAQRDAVHQLHLAAERGDQEALRALTERTLEMDALSIDTRHPSDGRSVIHSCVLSFAQINTGNVLRYMVKTLGAQIDARDGNGCTPLHAAAGLGHTRSIRTLIALGADSQALDQSGMNALTISASRGHLTCFVWLYQAGLSPIKPMNDGRSAIHLAAFAGQSSETPRLCCVERLLRLGVSLETKTRSGLTPCHFAAIGNKAHTVKKLCILGADVTAIDFQHGFSPLLMASAFGNLSVVRLLVLELGVKWQSDRRGFTAFHLAAQHGHLNVVNFLFAHVPFASKTRDMRMTLGSHLHDIVFRKTKSCSNAMTLGMCRRT